MIIKSIAKRSQGTYRMNLMTTPSGTFKLILKPTIRSTPHHYEQPTPYNNIQQNNTILHNQQN